MRRLLRTVLIAVLLIALAWGIRYCWVSFPVMTGFAAKNMCSGIFIQNRTPEDMASHELSAFPLSLVSCQVDYADSSVTARVLGLATKKAIYRRRLGATLVAGLEEAAIRKQVMQWGQPFPRPLNASWPLGNNPAPDSLLPANIAEVRAAVAAAFAEPDPKKPVNTRGVVVIYKGNLIAEQYRAPFTAITPQMGWSMAKSVTSALIGKLVAEGRLKLSDSQLMPQWLNATDGHERILLQHLLQQSSGIDFEEDYSKSSDATRMLTQQASMGDYTAGLPMRETPGSYQYYSSGNSNILSKIIRQKTGDAAYLSYVYDSLLYRIGMNSAVWEPDASGTLVGSSYLWASPQDWARLGQLYLQQGQWQGRQLLPAGWIQASVQPGLAPNGKHYGFQWWLNTGEDGKGNKRMLPGVPVDAYMAEGYEGQMVCVVPSHQLVVVRMGQTPKGRFSDDAFMKQLIALLP